MKSFGRRAALAVLACVVLSGITIHGAAVTTSTVSRASDVAPDPTFPMLLPLTFEVTSAEQRELKSLRDLTITAQREGEEDSTIVLKPVDPFTGENTCVRPMPSGIAGCVVNSDASVGTLRVNFNVPQAGIYRLVVSGKRGSDKNAETIVEFELEAKE